MLRLRVAAPRCNRAHSACAAWRASVSVAKVSGSRFALPLSPPLPIGANQVPGLDGGHGVVLVRQTREEGGVALGLVKVVDGRSVSAGEMAASGRARPRGW